MKDRIYIKDIIKYEGKRIEIFGWVHRLRDLGGVYFLHLRDRTGIVQVVFPKELAEKIKKIKVEFIVKIIGKVLKRPEEQIDKRLITGEYEIHAEDIEVVSFSKTPPFSVEREAILPKEEIRLKYRYLDLRREKLTRNLETRHWMMQITRNYLSEKGFWEIETPILAKSTPEGARDFLVPSRIFKGNFYALPQSPQLYKQILMVAGIDRYFQLARCLRDEDLRRDRQPEFTQIDIEASFIDEEFIYSLIEGLFEKWAEYLKIEIKTPFKRIPYSEAIEKYGSDKPDLTNPLIIDDFTDYFRSENFMIFKKIIEEKNGVVKGIKIEKELSRKEIEDIEKKVKEWGFPGIAWLKRRGDGITGPLSKFLKNFERENGTYLFLAGERKRVLLALGEVRNELKKFIEPEKGLHFVWVYEFPLFEYNEGEKRIEPAHHIFSEPLKEDMDKLNDDPLSVRGRIYDLVLNGEEIGSGSIRVNRRTLQERLFEIAGIDKRQFEFLLEAFDYGAPPHGGIALGFDRIVAIFTGTESIRDVIAFPKTTKAQGLMEGSPSEVSAQQLKELGIKFESSYG